MTFWWGFLIGALVGPFALAIITVALLWYASKHAAAHPDETPRTTEKPDDLTRWVNEGREAMLDRLRVEPPTDPPPQTQPPARAKGRAQ